MVRKGPEKSATLYKIGTKKKGLDGNLWRVIQTSNGIKRWQLHKKSITPKPKNTSKDATPKPKNTSKDATSFDKINFKLTKLGLLLLEFEDNDMFPDSLQDVNSYTTEFKKLWKILKDNGFIGTIKQTNLYQETYYLEPKSPVIYLINIVFEIGNREKKFHEPKKLKSSGIELLIKKLLKMKFIIAK